MRKLLLTLLNTVALLGMASMAFAARVSIFFCMNLFNGRAPN